MTGYCEGCERALLSRHELDQHYRTCHGFRAQMREENVVRTLAEGMGAADDDASDLEGRPYE